MYIRTYVLGEVLMYVQTNSSHKVCMLNSWESHTYTVTRLYMQRLRMRSAGCVVGLTIVHYYYYTVVLARFVGIHVTSYSLFGGGVQLPVCASMLLGVPTDVYCICALCPRCRPCSCDVCEWSTSSPHWTACHTDLQHCCHP